MKYRIWIRNVAAISCLWSAPLLFLGSCTENVLETKADNGEDALVEIVPGVRADGEDSENGSSSSNTGGNAVVSGPVDNSDLMNLPFWFARGEESRGGSYAWESSAIPATCEKFEDANNQYGNIIKFTPAQYYSDRTTVMVGWYPEGSFAEDGEYTAVTISFDGDDDIIASNALTGDGTDKGINWDASGNPYFRFEHQLTQLQFYVKGSALAIAQWGTIQKIELLKEANSCVLYLPLPEDESCTSDFKGSATLSVKGTALTIAQENTEFPFGEPVMIEPRTIGVRNTLTLRITGANKTAEVVIDNETHENVEFAAGYATKVVLELLPEDVKFNFIPTEWRSKNVTVDLGTQTYPYVPEETLCIVSRDLRGIISTKQLSAIFGSNNSVRVRNEKWTVTTEEENSIPAVLEVNDNDTMTATDLEDAKNQCKALGSNWRVPTGTEATLIQSKLGISDICTTQTTNTTLRCVRDL